MSATGSEAARKAWETRRTRETSVALTRKIVRNSTPTRESGLTWIEFLAGSQDHCYIPCPECHGYQRLTMWREAGDAERWMRIEEGDPLLTKEWAFRRTLSKAIRTLGGLPAMRPPDSQRADLPILASTAAAKDLADLPVGTVMPAPDGRGYLVKGIPATGQVWWPPELQDKRANAGTWTRSPRVRGTSARSAPRRFVRSSSPG